MSDSVGIYLHIPFCVRKCLYCDFCSAAASESVHEMYIAALCGEIDAFAGSVRPVDTLFIGGGTPSILEPLLIEQVMTALDRKFDLSSCREVTLEANPATVTRQKARAYRALGFTRASIGIQSFNDAELRLLGRLHTAKDAVECAETFADAGFDNLNFDLMYGIPSQTYESFRRTLQTALSLAPAHLSAYSLILEEGTPLYGKQNELSFPSAEEERAMYDLLTETTALHGYRHYEISNYARKGCECRHNLRYWQRKDYISFGVAAHSCIGNLRCAHTEHLENYLAGERGEHVVESLTEAEVDAERVMLGLRTSDGVDEHLLNAVAGEDKAPFLARCEREGYLVRKDGKIAPTHAGMYVSNAILREILPLFSK